MNELNETQIIAVEKVLNEMKNAEEVINSWNAYWCEKYEDCVLPQEYFDRFPWENKHLDKDEIPKIDKSTYTTEYNGIPLKHIMLGGKFSCDVGTIDWCGISTNNSTRRIVFHNDGSIYLEKNSIKNQTKKHPINIQYNANYNVLSADFDVSITIDQLTDDWREKYKYTYFTILLKDNVLTEKLNNIEIIKDLNTGTKKIKIEKKYDKRNRQNNTSVLFEAVLNQDDSLQIGAVAINTYKGNGKINGTYRFDVSRKKGIRANFYSRKGIKVDLTNNPQLLNGANILLLPESNGQNNSDIIVSNFANSTQNTIAKNLSEKVISFDNSDFNFEAVKEAEIKIIEMLKQIKGELPLQGLIERINDLLELIEIEKQQITTSIKILKLD